LEGVVLEGVALEGAVSVSEDSGRSVPLQPLKIRAASGASSGERTEA
jgi:hypothetical protein